MLAVFSLWPWIAGYRTWPYRIALLVVLGLMGWVARNRLARTRKAADASARDRDRFQRKMQG